MRLETKEFIQNWEKKLSQIKNDDNQLKELYDKFTTLFTIFNRYYNEAFYQLIQEKKLQKSRYSDYVKATSIVIEFLDSQSIIDIVVKNENQKDIDSVCLLIENEAFHINLADGEPVQQNDRQLLENLRNESSAIKAKAILSTIYNVRCNIVHGYKDFQEYQRLLVEPLIKLLESVIELLKEKFEEK